MKKYTFIFNIVTAFNNRGDLLINRALIARARDIGKVAVVTKGIPKPFLSKLGLAENEMYSSFWQCFKSNFGKRKLVKVGIPGHNFGKPSANAQSYFELIYTALFKFILRVEFIRIGTSVGNLDKSAIKIEKLKAKLYKIYGVRDNFSYNLFSPSAISYFPDLAFLSKDFELNNQKSKHLKKIPYIFLSFRPSFPDAEISYDYLNAIIKNLLVFIERREENLIKVAFQVPEDRTPCFAISKAISALEGKTVEFIDETLELDESIDIIANANLVVSNRLHVLLPALMSGVCHIALTDLRHHRKLVSLYETIGAGFALQDINSIEPLTLTTENERENLLKIAKSQIDIAEQKVSQAFE